MSVIDSIPQQLLSKFEQASNGIDDLRTVIQLFFPLCSELIELVEKTQSDDLNHLQSCVELVKNRLSDFQVDTRLENEQKLVRIMFFQLLDILSKSQIHMYWNDDPAMTTLQKNMYQQLTDSLLSLATSTIPPVPFKGNDDRERKYTNTFVAMHKRMKRDIELFSQTSTSDEEQTNIDYSFLNFFWNLSDCTMYVPWLLGIDLIPSILECLKIINFPADMGNAIINIIHNICRHDDGVDEFNQFDGLNIILEFQSCHADTFCDKHKLVLSMAIALLTSPQQIQSDNKRKNTMLNQLLQMVINTSEGENYRDDEGFHVSEGLAVLTKLFVDDRSLEYILSHAETDPQLTESSTIGLFIELLNKFRNAFTADNQLEQITCLGLLNILWSISFNPRYKGKLKQNQDFLPLIESLARGDGDKVTDQYVPRSMDSKTKCANGILHNLCETSTDVISDIKDVGVHIEKPMLMISYAHENNPFCDMLLAEFEKNKNLFRVWIDRYYCSSNGDLWEKIGRGITESQIVVCLISTAYFNSKSCRKEVTFAIKRNKSIIPIYIGQPGDCDWLGESFFETLCIAWLLSVLDIHIADLKYVRFKDDVPQLIPGKVQELLTTIQATFEKAQSSSPKAKQEISSPVLPNTKPMMNKSTDIDVNKLPEEWTPAEIAIWFNHHKVPDNLVKLFDFQSGTEMQRYADKLKPDPSKEFVKYQQRYAKHYGADELEEYVFDRFKKALINLPTNPSNTLKASRNASPPLRSQSSVCAIQ